MKKYLNKLWGKPIALLIVLFFTLLSTKVQAGYTMQLILSTSYGGSSASTPLCVNSTSYYYLATVLKASGDDGSGVINIYFKASDNSVYLLDLIGVSSGSYTSGVSFSVQPASPLSMVAAPANKDNGQIYATFVPNTGTNSTSSSYSTSAPYVTISPSSASLNISTGPTSVSLTASATSSSSFAWTPSTGLSATTGATVTASPPTSVTYTVTATATTGGCTGLKTVAVSVTGGPCCVSNKAYSNQTMVNTYTSDYITASGTSTIATGSTVVFTAGNYIQLNPDVLINSASSTLFTASIASCGYGACRRAFFEDDNSGSADFNSSDPLNEVIIPGTITVYPNPSSGVFTISSDANLDAVVVSNSLGNIILNDSKTQVDLSNQPDGIYFLSISSNGKTVVKKVFKK